MGYDPFDNIPHSNLGHYIVQQNCYKWIVERNYGINIKEMYLLQLHPSIPTFIEFPLPDIQSDIDVVMALRREKVHAGELRAVPYEEVLASAKKRKPVDDAKMLEDKARRNKLVAFYQSRIDELAKED